MVYHLTMNVRVAALFLFLKFYHICESRKGYKHRHRMPRNSLPPHHTTLPSQKTDSSRAIYIGGNKWLDPDGMDMRFVDITAGFNDSFIKNITNTIQLPENKVSVSTIASHIRKMSVLSTLQHPNISMLHKLQVIEINDILQNEQNLSPNITSGGLLEDWNYSPNKYKNK